MVSQRQVVTESGTSGDGQLETSDKGQSDTGNNHQSETCRQILVTTANQSTVAMEVTSTNQRPVAHWMVVMAQQEASWRPKVAGNQKLAMKCLEKGKGRGDEMKLIHLRTASASIIKWGMSRGKFQLDKINQ